jgi:hypothetical protein
MLALLSACHDSGTEAGSNVAVTENPSDVSVAAGASATFTAAATGTPAPTVQWQQSTDGGTTFSDVAGATAASLTFATAESQNGNEFRAVFTNSTGSATTSAAKLTLTSNVVVTSNPSNVSVAAGASATFTAAATGTPAPTVQWQQSSDGGTTFTDVAGATAASLTFATAESQNGNEYRAVFSNNSGTATTSAAKLTLTSNVVVTSNPSNVSVAAGASATFTAAASGTPVPTVQWQQSSDGGTTFTDVAGATAASLTFVVSAGQGGDQFRAVFSNDSGTATTNAATLTITAAVSGKQWRTAQQIDVPTGTANFSDFEPVQAVDANGDVIALWSHASGQYVTVWANRYTAATGWGAAQLISSATDTAQTGQLSIASDPSGNALAVWTQTPGTSGANRTTGIFSSRFDAGTQAWSSPQLIGGNDTTDAMTPQPYGSLYPQVAFDANGNAFAVWEQTNGQSNATPNVWAARYTAGAGWAAAVPITNENDVSAGNRQIGMDAAGDALVVYTAETIVSGHGDIRLKALRYQASTGTWGSAQFIAPDTGYEPEVPSLAVDPAGDAVVVWFQANGDMTNNTYDTHIMANQYQAATGAWGTAQFIDTLTAGSAQDARVAIDAGGGAWAVWSQGERVVAGHYASGGWSSPQFLDAGTGAQTNAPQIALDPEGNAMAIWMQLVSLVQSGSAYTLITAAYFTAGSWGTPEVLETVAGQSNNPTILLDASGNATAAWDKGTNLTTGTSTIWAARFQ